MGIFNKIRGGAGSNHYSGRNDYPYAGDGAPAQPTYGGNDFANEVSSAPKAKPAPVEAPPGGSQRYQIHGGGGDYLQVTKMDGKHNITRYGSKGESQYQTKGADFHHDTETGEASWGGGKDHLGMGGSGKLKMSSGPYNY
jgi:hypothetical protein